MFAFHKPKVYRSTEGCCICKAKSSSSRFTDSKKYEDYFERCFLLKEQRQGEICNACVLLVKRYMRLPPGSRRNWVHVSIEYKLFIKIFGFFAIILFAMSSFTNLNSFTTKKKLVF